MPMKQFKVFTSTQSTCHTQTVFSATNESLWQTQIATHALQRKGRDSVGKISTE